MNQLSLSAYAKVNLFLRILGKRQDGYHDLISLICGIDLCDTVTLTMGGHESDVGPLIHVICSHPEVPEGPDNIAYRAAALFFESSNLKAGVTISIEKAIPVAAGLGGGSSDAASVLIGLNQLYSKPFSQKELMAMGTKIGADVPFFVFGGRPAIARGIGEQLTPFNNLCPLYAVLVCPKFRVSTAWAYQNLRLPLTNGKQDCSLARFWETSFNKDSVKECLWNDLESVTLEAYSDIRDAKRELLGQGAEGALMSGSGPSVFGLFHTQAQAQQACNRLQDPDRWTIILTRLRID